MSDDEPPKDGEVAALIEQRAKVESLVGLSMMPELCRAWCDYTDMLDALARLSAPVPRQERQPIQWPDEAAPVPDNSGTAQPDTSAFDLLAALLDIWDDRNLHPDHRCYVPGAFPDEMERVRAYVAKREAAAPVPAPYERPECPFTACEKPVVCQAENRCINQLHPPPAVPAREWIPVGAILEIAQERNRQIHIEDWTPNHDDQHIHGALAAAGASYALLGAAHSANPGWSEEYRQTARKVWPYDEEFYKPKDARRDLIRAGALIVAEIERLDRLPPPPAADK